MSSVVAEANAQLSSQISKPKSGQSGQPSSGGGFSGLVDSNLDAAADADTGSTPAKPRKANATASTNPEPVRTGLQRKTRNTEPAQKTVPAEKPARQTETQPAEATAEATLAIEAAAKTGIVGANVSAEAVEAVPETTAEQPQQPAAPATTGIVVAVALPTETLVATAPMIEGAEAITVTNPPATIANPAETAANALAKVAAETGETKTDNQTKAASETEATVQTPVATAEAAPKAAAIVETAAKTEPVVESAAPEVQVEAKAKAELATAAKPAEPSVQVAPPVHGKLEAAAKIELASVKEQPASEQPQGAKPVARDDDRVEQKPAAQTASEKPADGEAKPAAHRLAQEPPVQAATHAQAEKPQPNGFGLTQVAALHVPNVALQSAAFTAVAATGTPVPVNGLAVEIAANVQIGRSRFEIRLDPPELGRIDVRLDVDKQGQVTSHLIVEKSATLDLLRRDAQQLERALQDAGLKTSDNGLQFSLRDQQQSGRGDEGNQRNAHRLIVTEEETTTVETAGRSYGRMIGQRGGIDIRV